MTISNTLTVLPQQLTSVDLCATTNIAGNYYNGTSNDGVGAMLTIADSTLFDNNSLSVNQRLLLPCQTDTTQNGIYKVTSIVDGIATLYRASDFQCAEQIKPGYFVFVSGGTLLASFIYVVYSGPYKVGFEPILFTSSNVYAFNTSIADIESTNHTFTVQGLSILMSINGSMYTYTTPSLIQSANVTADNTLEVIFTVTPGAGTIITVFMSAPYSR